MKWTAGDVVLALRESYGLAHGELVTEEWALVTEVPLRTKAVHGGREVEGYWGNTRTIDVLLTRNWLSGKGHERVAVEVKVSRSDYKNETPIKRAPAEAAAHRTVYAAPVGLIAPETLPEGWGLIEVYETVAAAREGKGWELGDWRVSRCRWRVRAALREPSCDLNYLVSAGMRRASRLEERLRRGEDDVALVPTLRQQVASLEGKLDRRDLAIDRERKRASDALAMLRALEGGQVCADCGEPIKPRWGHGYIEWVHTDKHTEGICYEARADERAREREARTGARYIRGWAGPVTPRTIREAMAETEEGTPA